jgi:hypothetical protein
VSKQWPPCCITAKLVLLGIANHAGDGGAWPSVATLAKYANVEPRNVRRALKSLAVAGELKVYLQAGGLPGMADWSRPNRYDVTVQCPEECDRSTNHKLKAVPGGASITRGDGGDVTGGMAPASPKPPTEPSFESSSFESPDESSAPPTTTAPPKPKKTKQEQAPRTTKYDELIKAIRDALPSALSRGISKSTMAKIAPDLSSRGWYPANIHLAIRQKDWEGAEGAGMAVAWLQDAEAPNARKDCPYCLGHGFYNIDGGTDGMILECDCGDEGPKLGVQGIDWAA